MVVGDGGHEGSAAVFKPGVIGDEEDGGAGVRVVDVDEAPGAAARPLHYMATPPWGGGRGVKGWEVSR